MSAIPALSGPKKIGLLLEIPRGRHAQVSRLAWTLFGILGRQRKEFAILNYERWDDDNPS
jgi:hypothetical protein